MKRPDDNSFDFEELSDSQLDELLGLATPKLERKRQQRLRRRVHQLLRANRVDSSASVAAVRWVLVGSCILAVAWIGWRYLDHEHGRPHESRKALAAGANRVDAVPATAAASTVDPTIPVVVPDLHVGVGHAVVDVHIPETDATKLTPPITKPNRFSANGLSSTLHRKRRSRVRFKTTFEQQTATLVQRMNAQLENGLWKIADSQLGLELAGKFAELLDGYDPQGMQTARVRHSRAMRVLRHGQEYETRMQIAVLQQFRRNVEVSLMQRLTRTSRDRTKDVAAYRLLCRIGSRNSLPTILSHWNYPPTQPDAVAAAIRLADSRTLGRLVLETSREDLQSQLMAGLLCRDDPGGLDLFLELTAKHDLYPVARDSGAIAKCVPTERLLNRLRSNRLAIARAAAVTMSEMDDPRIPRYLIELAVQPASKQSAVMALTARSDPSSVQFVELASTDIRWSATVNNEKRKWGRWLSAN